MALTCRDAMRVFAEVEVLQRCKEVHELRNNVKTLQAVQEENKKHMYKPKVLPCDTTEGEDHDGHTSFMDLGVIFNFIEREVHGFRWSAVEEEEHMVLLVMMHRVDNLVLALHEQLQEVYECDAFCEHQAKILFEAIDMMTNFMYRNHVKISGEASTRSVRRTMRQIVEDVFQRFEVRHPPTMCPRCDAASMLG